jgi:ubiquinone/menaquinone biosynthesis C-methylase UbiE
VIATTMLYQVPDRQRALSEIHRVLKPDGYFYASTIGEESFSEMNRLMGQNSLTPSPWVKRLGFSLENGGEQLSFWFTHLDLHRLVNTLMITETEPLLQMMRSGLGDSVDEETFRHLHEGIDQEVTQHGGFRSTMHLGLFVAHGRK